MSDITLSALLCVYLYDYHSHIIEIILIFVCTICFYYNLFV